MKKKAAKSKIKEKLNFKKLILAVIISVAAGVIGSLVTSPSILTWYATLNKTILTPPNWVFAPVVILCLG